MICPECGSYQPDRAKFCGICGSPLSQESLVESFLKQPAPEDIVLPRHRGVWFYVILCLAILLALAVLAGAGYLVYRKAWGGDRGKGQETESLPDDMRDYRDIQNGFSFSYPDDWSLESRSPGEGEVASMRVTFTSRKFMDLKVLMLDPVIAVGGLEGIREYLEEAAVKRLRSLGGSLPVKAGPADQTQEAAEEPDVEEPAGSGGTEAPGEGGILTYTRFSSMPAFYVEFTANVAGEATQFMLCYVVSSDLYFVCEGRAPVDEYRALRPRLWSIIASLRRMEKEGESAQEGVQ